MFVGHSPSGTALGVAEEERALLGLSLRSFRRDASHRPNKSGSTCRLNTYDTLLERV